ncbi:predicted protein [Methanosarcina acetivorans C2A]|uniref:Uncharacterized protein n=1 Tax=Methanosarcina acetivorans (strain ATCC 35395 / DSM 2834 / JCM 12185 / C2A) TaxID=188937 RepID=Q8TI60_METAC|nr:predicted protein [Methanosarcina acetivorans C2A]
MISGQNKNSSMNFFSKYWAKFGNGIETSNGSFVEVPNLPYHSHIFGITVSLPLQGGPNSFPGHTLIWT